ncbi:MAG: RNA polymerase sigma factor [Candidatus Sumerlaeaceae bacterium]|nr:RNA polymerase sigma factor [Candidatus Sumerlaeaceae bacterium]
MEQQPSDSELIARAAAGQQAAFEALVDKYFGLVYSVAFARIGCRETAEELAQEVFLRTYFHLGPLAGVRNYAAWVTRVTRNLAEDWQRSGQRVSRAMTMIHIEDLPREVPDTEPESLPDRINAREQSALLWTALTRLPVHLREMILMHFRDDVSKADIARHLGIHPSSVGRQITGALEALRTHLGPQFDLPTAVPQSSRASQRRAVVALLILAAMPAARQTAVAAALGETAAIAAPVATASLLTRLIAGLNGLATMKVSVRALTGTTAMGIMIGFTLYYLHTSMASGGGPSSPEAEMVVACGSVMSEMVYHEYKLQHVTTEDAIKALKPLLTPKVGAVVSQNAAANSITVGDNATAQAAIAKKIQDIDHILNPTDTGAVTGLRNPLPPQNAAPSS